jgi:TatD DNase family protein
MNVIDTHSHFNLPQFDIDRDVAITRMEGEEVGTICVGIDKETSALALELASKHESIWACIGQHPTEWCKAWDNEEMRKLAQGTRVVAIGECGLDYFRQRERDHTEEQEALFRKQIELAKELRLPLMLHIRPQEGTMDAYDRALDILKEYKADYPLLTGTAHFFAGDMRIAKEFLDLGFYISFSGVITFVPHYEELVSFVPIDRILPETDAPFAAPAPYRGKRAEPAYVVEVVQKIADIKQLSRAETEQKLLENTKRLFILL